MEINVNHIITLSPTLEETLKFILGNDNMSKALDRIKEEVAALTDAIEAQHASFDLLVREVKQLIENGDQAAAIELLDEIAADKQAILDSVAFNTDLAAQVDAINGDPSPAV